jgi:ABC-type uncharacterized transport system involved in gliding motility auxiliary subunit
MKRRKIRNQHIVELVITLVIIFLLNFIGSSYYYRFDLTTEKRYTLSPATKEILTNLDDIVYIKVYLDGELPSGFIRMKTAISELLDEFRWHSPANIRYDFIDPLEDPASGETLLHSYISRDFSLQISRLNRRMEVLCRRSFFPVRLFPMPE